MAEAYRVQRCIIAAQQKPLQAAVRRQAVLSEEDKTAQDQM